MTTISIGLPDTTVKVGDIKRLTLYINAGDFQAGTTGEADITADFPPTWSASGSDGEFCHFTVAADGRSAVFTATAVGSSEVEVEATVNGTLVEGACDVTIVANSDPGSLQVVWADEPRSAV